jgi:hypothetical protein
MIKISEKILDFEPHDRLAVVADAMVSLCGFVGTGHEASLVSWF